MNLQQWKWQKQRNGLAERVHSYDNGSEIDAPHQKMPSGLGVQIYIKMPSTQRERDRSIILNTWGIHTQYKTSKSIYIYIHTYVCIYMPQLYSSICSVELSPTFIGLDDWVVVTVTLWSLNIANWKITIRKWVHHQTKWAMASKTLKLPEVGIEVFVQTTCC